MDHGPAHVSFLLEPKIPSLMKSVSKLGNDKVVEEEIVYDGRDGRDRREAPRGGGGKKVPPSRAF
jgi:hypothetical protein